MVSQETSPEARPLAPCTPRRARTIGIGCVPRSGTARREARAAARGTRRTSATGMTCGSRWQVRHRNARVDPDAFAHRGVDPDAGLGAGSGGADLSRHPRRHPARAAPLGAAARGRGSGVGVSRVVRGRLSHPMHPSGTPRAAAPRRIRSPRTEAGPIPRCLGPGASAARCRCGSMVRAIRSTRRSRSGR